MRTPLVPASPEPERLIPVEQDPDVVAAWQTVVTAREAVREAGERLTRARDIAGRQFRETPTHIRERSWTTREFWRSRSDLPRLEEGFDLAQAALVDAEATHAEAVAHAKAVLTPRVQAQLVPQLKAAVAALASVRPVLAAWADGVQTASALGVTAPGPGLLLTILATDMATLAATIEAWAKGPPQAPPLLSRVAQPEPLRVAHMEPVAGREWIPNMRVPFFQSGVILVVVPPSAKA